MGDVKVFSAFGPGYGGMSTTHGFEANSKQDATYTEARTVGRQVVYLSSSEAKRLDDELKGREGVSTAVVPNGKALERLEATVRGWFDS